jgi:hypothetical protein
MASLTTQQPSKSPSHATPCAVAGGMIVFALRFGLVHHHFFLHTSALSTPRETSLAFIYWVWKVRRRFFCRAQHLRAKQNFLSRSDFLFSKCYLTVQVVFLFFLYLPDLLVVYLCIVMPSANTNSRSPETPSFGDFVTPQC